jgi:hypothetical protein
MKSRQRATLKGLPPGLIGDLPIEDRQALLSVVGKQLHLNAYDEDGRAELEFTDAQGVSHTIWVDPQFIDPND